jgi:DNA-binding CsgD family transcriptional regulator
MGDDPTSSSDDALLRAVAAAPPRAPTRALAPDDRIGPFRIVARLGSGGMGVVYRARDERLGRDVALKVIASDAEDDGPSRARFALEARAAAAINHPNVATIYEVGEDDGRVFIAMELVLGITLRERLSAGAMPVAEAVAVARGILHGLARAHDRGVVHRDLKPDNVMLGETVKLLDFGLAQTARDDDPDPGAGTLGYAAPEQLDGAAPDVRADVFAFGVTLYEMLAGTRPFVGETRAALVFALATRPHVALARVRAEVPADLSLLVDRCLARQVASRFASAREVLEALDAIVVRTPHDARSAAHVDGATRWSPPRFVGRDTELAELRAAWRGLSESGGRVVLIAGEAGVGKTRLLDAFLGEVATSGARVLRGAAFEGQGEPAYAPWMRALAAIGAPDTDDARLDVAEERVRFAESVHRAIADQTRSGAAIVAIEDLHWADDDSLRLFRHLARGAADHSLLLVATYRDTPPEARAIEQMLSSLRREAWVSELVLRGFTIGEATAFLAVTDRRLPQELVETLHAETGGNAFFLRELFRHRVESGLAISGAAGDAPRVPESVRQVLASRLALLRESTRAVLRVASIFAEGFRLGDLAAATGGSYDAVLDALDDAVASSVVVPPSAAGGAYAMSHAVLRRAIYDDMNPDRRAALHRRVAESLAAAGADPAEVAAQFAASAALPGASAGVPFALAAADAAERRAADAHAVRHLRLAHALSPPSFERARIAEKLALTEAASLELDVAARDGARAVEEMEAAGIAPKNIAAFLGELCRRLQVAGAATALWEPLASSALRRCGATRDLTWARLQLLRSRFEPVETGLVHVSRWLGHDPEAVAVLMRDGDEDDRARVLQAYDHRSDEEMRSVLARADSAARPTAVMHALDVAARDALYRRGRLRDALPILERLVAAGTRYGSVTAAVEGAAQLSLCLLQLGDFAAADAWLARARGQVGRLGAEHRLHLVVDVAVAAMHAYVRHVGDLGAIAEQATRASAQATLSRGPLGATIAGLAAIASVRAGDPDGARRITRALTTGLEGIEPTAYIANGALFNAAATAWELGWVEPAARLRAIGERMLAAGVTGGPCCSLTLAVARMAALEGDDDVAMRMFDRARRDLDSAGYLPMLAIATYDEAIVLSGRDVEASHARMDEARAAFERLHMDGWARAARRADKSSSGSRSSPRPAGLTAREVDVVELVAAGLANHEIAARLLVTTATVQRYLSAVYAKTGTRARSDVVAFAAQAGLGSRR